jgi:hypothetical protein
MWGEQIITNDKVYLIYFPCDANKKNRDKEKLNSRSNYIKSQPQVWLHQGLV